MTMHEAIEVRELVHRYGDRTALDGVDLAVGPGKIFALLGPNGGGKSTLFRILTTLLIPTSGEAHVAGCDIRRQPAEVRRRIGVIFQSPSLDKKLSVEENVRCHGHLYGLSGRALRQRVTAVLATVQLEDRRAERVEKLSGGLMRRVEIAKSLVHSPDVLLLDEPSTGLDPRARRALREQLEALRQSLGVTCLLTTHLMEEADSCDRVAILDHGRIVAMDSPRALKGAIRGDVITIASERAAEVRDELARDFRVEGRIMGDSVLVEQERGHELAARLAAALGDRIDGISVSRPTLDDVFFHHTGHRLEEGAS